MFNDEIKKIKQKLKPKLICHTHDLGHEIGIIL